MIVIHCYGYLEFHWQLCNYLSRNGDDDGSWTDLVPASDVQQLTVILVRVVPVWAGPAQAMDWWRAGASHQHMDTLHQPLLVFLSFTVEHLSRPSHRLYASGAHFEFTGNSLSNTLRDKENFSTQFMRTVKMAYLDCMKEFKLCKLKSPRDSCGLDMTRVSLFVCNIQGGTGLTKGQTKSLKNTCHVFSFVKMTIEIIQ